METFDSTKTSLKDLLGGISTGRIQLPDFQRGWVWDDEHVRSLLVSIARSFPIGAVMLLETGGEIRFQVRPIEGLDHGLAKKEPEQLILDGQQRLTSLTQAIHLTTPVDTRTAKGKEIKRHYYFDIKKALEGEQYLEDAVIAVDEHRQIRGNFGRDLVLDLSSRQLECEQLYFPCDQVMNSDEWEEALQKFAPEKFKTYMDFRLEVINAFRSYHLPVIELKKETTKEAVCLVFEKVNTGGVQLSVFELVTASYAADGYNLRDDWFGSDIRDVQSRQSRISEKELLKGVSNTDFLQVITLLHTHKRRQQDIDAGKTGKFVRPVSVKRQEVLNLPLQAYKDYADMVEEAFKQTANFLRKECFFKAKEVPYTTQLLPLAGIMYFLKSRWLEPKIYQKICQWFWCGVLGELYGGAVETRIAIDFEELQHWFSDDSAIPKTITDASFQTDRLDSLRSRLSAAYKGINVLVLRQGAKDFYWHGPVLEIDHMGESLDIHHIFPKEWCKTKGYLPKRFDSIINKTPISYKANRTIGGAAPSVYLKKIEDDDRVSVSEDELNMILKSHHIHPESMRRDDFEKFWSMRKKALTDLIYEVMGKQSLDSSGHEIEWLRYVNEDALPVAHIVVDHDLPEPEVGYEVIGDESQVIFELELAWPSRRTGIVRNNIEKHQGWTLFSIDLLRTSPQLLVDKLSSE